MRRERSRATARLGRLVAALALAATPVQGQRPAPTLVVSPHGPLTSIAAAVRQAPAGARIVVRAGTYREAAPVEVDRPLTLEGDGSFPTLDGGDGHELLHVTAPDVTVRGLRFTRTGRAMTEDRAAVRLTGATGCTVAGNRFDDTFFGVYLARVAGCAVRDNVFAGRPVGTESTSGNAVHLWSSRDVAVTGNRITGHRDGIYFEFVRQGRVERNLSTGNLRYGLHFMYSDSCAYRENTFRDNGAGVAVMYTNVVTMRGNRFVDNMGGAAYGLLLKEIGHATLEHNEFARNTVGLMADGASHLVVRGNVFRDNGWGLRLMSNVLDGEVAGNDFAANTFDVSTNGRQDDATFRGNWFAEYRGWDLDRDGRGDVPYHPVRLFSLLVARHEPMLALQRSVFVALLDAAERVLPSLTPETLRDDAPAMRPNRVAAR
jgi:nitrous oxidase accessory protein